MKIKPFELERYFAKYEFSAPYLLSCSDCEALTLKELLPIADNESLKLWEDLNLGYTESQGHPLLREEISTLYSKIKPEQVLCITPAEGIFIAMNTLLENGDHVVTTFPGYQSLYEISNAIGCEISKWIPTNNEGWKFNIEDLKALIQSNTKLLIINFPHNPTGAIISKDELQEIVDMARVNNIYIFSDEMYRFLEQDSKDRLPSVSDLYENAISLFGMSKSFALAGLRIGWLTTQNSELYKRFAIFKDYTTICSSAPSEILAIMGLRAKDKIFRRNLNIIEKNLDILDSFFTKYNEIFTWYRPTAGPIVFPKLNADIDISKLCLELVETKGVMLLPSNVYNFEGNYFRIGYARNNMPTALEKFDEYLKESDIKI